MNSLLSTYKKDYIDQLNYLNKQINDFKITDTEKKYLVSKIDRNSILHLETYNKRKKFFHNCKKIIIFLLIFCILLKILYAAMAKYSVKK